MKKLLIVWCSTTGGTRQMAEAAERGARDTLRPGDRVEIRRLPAAEAEPVLVITHAQTPESILAPKTIGMEDLARCERAGALLAAGLSAGIF